MNEPDPERVLVLAPYGRDAELIGQALSKASIAWDECENVASLTESMQAGAAAAIVADEALDKENIPVLAQALRSQPRWSDFPLLLMTGSGEVTEASRFRLRLFASLGNVTLIERPLRTVTLLSAVTTALRSRRHQYQIRDQFEQERRLACTLRENEEKLTFALEAAQSGSWELELPSRKLHSSDQCRRNFGLAAGEPFPYDRFVDLIHPEDRARVERQFRDSLSGRRNYQSEYRVLRPDGEQAWIYAAGRPLYGPDGEPCRMVGVTLDITERRKGEEAIRESEAQLQALADSIPQLAWMANPDGHIFWYNRRWYEYTGTTLEQMLGWGWLSVHDPQMLPQVLEQWKASIRTGGPFEMEFPLRDANGNFRWFLTRVRPVRSAKGEVVRWFGTNTDIDDKRAAEKALRESEELARSVIQSSPDCVEVLDVSGRTLMVNAEGCRLLGLSENDARLKKRWLDSWTGKDRLEAAKALDLALAGNKAHFQASSRMSANGQRWWDVIVSPIVGPDGNPSKLLCVSRDITTGRQAEEQLRQRAKLESLGVMAGGIAHDFNNLLTSILGNASLLLETVSATERRLAEDIVLASERAAELTKQMLAYSGKGRFDVTQVDLSVRVREILRLVQPSMDKKVEVALELSSQPCVLEGDPSQIQQVIMNLVINAGEAFEGQPGRVVVETGKVAADSAYISRNLSPNEIPPGDYVYLIVRDNGKGMDEETRAKIFDPFFSTKFTGRGLGLAAVSGIVRGHHGALRVNSVPGEGTTFMVLFPAVESEQPLPPQETKEIPRGNGLVLLVDDEEVVQRIAVTALERQGYDVRVAGNGQEAVNIFAELREQISLVLLDMTMPVMSGEETLQRLRQIQPDVQVIVSSGYNEVEVARRFSNQRFTAFLQKPYSALQLAEKVRAVREMQNRDSGNMARGTV